MFVDASVMLAMMTDEEAARDFSRRMQASTVRLTSPIAVASAAAGLVSKLGLPAAEAAEAARMFLQLMNIQSVAVPPRAAYLAMEALAAFGTGASALDLDDCMTYACARYYRQPLLSATDRWASTDLELA